MDNFLLLKNSDKQAYFDVVAHELDVIPHLIEKDFWVCWTLKMLFSLPTAGTHLTFKGGTSLSKCYDLIKRFSEDLDVSIERSFLASQESIEPEENQSGKENKRRLERLKQLCQENIDNTILPELREKIKSLLSGVGDWNLEMDPYDNDSQTILFTYPKVLESSMDNYIKPVVKIELGARSDHWPVESVIVKPYVANVTDKMIIEGASVRVLKAERTFWEKATILHAINHSSKLRARMSRHYYDFFQIVNSSIYKNAIENLELLIKVAEHKELFFKDNKARYDLARPGSLKLVPQSEHVAKLKADYQQMQEMFFENPPPFDAILEKIEEAEGEINGMGK